MNTIEVDFDVFKQLTVRRATEAVSYNDVIRELLGLGQDNARAKEDAIGQTSDDWVTKGVRFPAGTEFRASYKGQIHTGRVESGALAVNGKRFEDVYKRQVPRFCAPRFPCR